MGVCSATISENIINEWPKESEYDPNVSPEALNPARQHRGSADTILPLPLACHP